MRRSLPYLPVMRVLNESSLTQRGTWWNGIATTTPRRWAAGRWGRNPRRSRIQTRT